MNKMGVYSAGTLKLATSTSAEIKSSILSIYQFCDELQKTCTTTSIDIASFSRISLPLLKHNYPSLIADKLISVQPLVGVSFPLYDLNPPKKKSSRYRDLDAEWES